MSKRSRLHAHDNKNVLRPHPQAEQAAHEDGESSGCNRVNVQRLGDLVRFSTTRPDEPSDLAHILIKVVVRRQR